MQQDNVSELIIANLFLNCVKKSTIPSLIFKKIKFKNETLTYPTPDTEWSDNQPCSYTRQYTSSVSSCTRTSSSEMADIN